MRNVIKLTTRTRDLLRKNGWACDIVERRSAHGAFDFLGFADVVGIKAGRKPIAVQATEASNKSTHVTKMLECKRLHEWTENGGRALLMIWKKIKGKWEVHETLEFIHPGAFQAAEIDAEIDHAIVDDPEGDPGLDYLLKPGEPAWLRYDKLSIRVCPQQEGTRAVRVQVFAYRHEDDAPLAAMSQDQPDL